MITAGPTREPIDPVRFLSNYSTGHMGVQLATAALARGHRVTVVSGPLVEPMPTKARVIAVETARQMEHALYRHARGADVIIMAAAVSDFRPARARSMKLPRRARYQLQLEATPDIIGRLPRTAGQVVAGFALETESVRARAERKLRTKRLDLLLAQRVHGASAPFGRTTVHAWLLERGGAVTPLGRVSKAKVARVLLDKIEALWYGQRESSST